MWVWILAVFSLILIWGGYFVAASLDVALSPWVPWVATALVVLFVAGVFVVRRLRAVARAKALERELLRQSEQQAALARPDRRAEILELQRQLEQGIQALKHSKVGKRHGSQALYALPWYAIIGPPGAGKTTALRHSGLVFPFLDPKGGGGVRGVGGTRNCDWWFTNDAILLDTAGRYTTQEEDLDEWLGFLGLLRKFRPQKPLNGLLVAIAVSDLIEATDDQIGTFAQRLRARIDEIMTRLDVVLPVYVVFTKVDLVAGFVEYWGDLRKSERDQIFGATLAYEGGESRPAPGAFAREFDTLASNLHSRALRVIGQERNVEARQKIFQFPLEFRALRQNLETFTQLLFQRNSFQETPIFRGFYFTSGTQEGRPIDRLISGMARAFGLRPRQTDTPPADPKSYFVTDLFQRVVFPDQDIAVRTQTEMKRQRLLQFSLAGGALLLSALIAIPALISYAKNRELVNDVEAAGKNAAAANWKDPAVTEDKYGRLAALERELKRLDGWEQDGPPVSMRWGLYTGSTLYPAARDAFGGTLDSQIVSPAKSVLEGKLRSVAEMQLMPPQQFAQHYQALKLYIMMSDKTRVDPEWAGSRVVGEWSQVAPPAGSSVGAGLVGAARYYADFVKRGELPPWKIDDALVRRVRSVLLQAPQLDRLYDVLVREANEEIAPIRREAIFYGSIAPFVTSKKNLRVDGAYTRQGWERVRTLLGAQRDKLADERWVLGETTQATQAIEKQVTKLRDLYFARHQAAWRDFLMDLEVRVPENALVALDELNALSEPEWPYLRLLRIVNDNVTLEVDDPDKPITETITEQVKEEVKKRFGDGGAPAPKRKISPVERAFKPLTSFAIAPEGKAGDQPEPTGLSQYMAILAKLVGVLSDLRDGQVEANTKQLATEFEQAFRATSAMLAGQDGFTRPLLSPLLMRPLTGAWTGVVMDASGAAGGLWEVTVWDKWRPLEPSFPFVDAPKDVKIEDFTEFFRPETGTLWSFYNENLAGSIERVGPSFRPRRRFASSPAFTSQFLDTCLKRGAEISDALFPPKSETPTLAFEVNLHSVSPDVSEVRLEIDGATYVYKNTPEQWLKAQWPAKEPEARGARVRVRGFNGLDEEIIRSGDFGFFRLLRAADNVVPGTAGGRRGAEPTLVATWQLRSPGAFFKLDVKEARSTRAILGGLFEEYKCPRVIATASN